MQPAAEEQDVELLKKVKIIETEDVSSGSNIRSKVIATVPENVSENDILHITKFLVQYYINENVWVNALSFYFYDDKVYINRVSPLAIADWAPNGNWADAANMKTGNYTKHKITVNSFYETNNEVTLTQQDKEIYNSYQLLFEENPEISDESAQNAIANQYSITPEEVENSSVSIMAHRSFQNISTNLSADTPTKQYSNEGKILFDRVGECSETAFGKGDVISINLNEKLNIVHVIVGANDSFSGLEGIKEGILLETKDFLKDVKVLGLSEIYVDWSAPMVDKFGNESTEIILEMGIKKTTIDKINFDNFLAKNIPDIAELYKESTIFE